MYKATTVLGAVAMIIIPLAVNWEALQSHGVKKVLRDLATPHSGESEVLPESVQSVLKLVRTSGVRSITISDKVSDNRFIAQPLTESVYPVEVTAKGDLFISYPSENLPSGCRTLQVEKGIRVAACR
jgi:hypothetical protein